MPMEKLSFSDGFGRSGDNSSDILRMPASEGNSLGLNSLMQVKEPSHDAR